MGYSSAPGSDYFNALSDPIRVYAIPVSTRISVSAAPTPVVVGDTTTVSGLVEREQPGGSWTPLPGQEVRVFFAPGGSQSPSLITTTHSGADGTYQVPVSFPAASGSIKVDNYRYPTGAGPYRFAESFTDQINARYRTQITSFNAAPEPVKKGATLTVSGKLERYASVWGPVDGVPVSVYFKPSGATALTSMGTTTTEQQGNWIKSFKASKDGTWYAKFQEWGPYLAADSSGDAVDVT
jgi:hypothetical protein